MSETVAKGYVLIPVHNLSTNWLSGKRQEKKNTVSRQIELRYKMVAAQLRSWTVIFLLFLPTNSRSEIKRQSPLAVQIRTDASGNHHLP